MINLIKIAAIGLHCYLISLVLAELMPKDGAVFAFWELVALAGMQLAGGQANKRAAKRANRKNRRQADRDWETMQTNRCYLN